MKNRILDTRPRRPLTSRELAAILGGLLGTLCGAGKVPLDDLHEATRHLEQAMRKGPSGIAEAVAAFDALNDGARGAAIMLLQVCIAWEDLGLPGAMHDALTFWAQRPAWDEIERFVEMGNALLASRAAGGPS